MNNFGDLVSFEFKKIFQRKMYFALIFLCFAGIAVMVFSSVSGNSFWHKIGGTMSQYEAMKQDKAAILSNRGYITSELVREAVLSNKEMIQNTDNYFIDEYGRHLKEEAYIKYALPYEPVVKLINTVYEDKLDWLSMDAYELRSVNPDKAINHLTPDMIQDFDADAMEFAVSMVRRQEGLSNAEVEKNIELLQQVKRPLYNDFYGGYQAYIKSSKGLALMVLLLILMLLAPLFSNEYEERTDQIILCTKNGKGSLCKAKLFAALTVSLLSSMLMMGIGLLSFLAVFGFEGANVNIQVVNPSCTYPITLLEACFIHALSVVTASVLFGALIAFLSAKVKRRTGLVVMTGTLITMIPMFIWVPLKSSRILYNILKLFPVNSITFGFDMHFIDILGVLMTPYKFNGAVSILLTIAFFSMAIYSFKNHKVA